MASPWTDANLGAFPSASCSTLDVAPAARAWEPPSVNMTSRVVEDAERRTVAASLETCKSLSVSCFSLDPPLL